MSNLLKPGHYVTVDAKRIIEAPSPTQQEMDAATHTESDEHEQSQAEEMRAQYEKMKKRMIEEARQEAAQLIQAAQAESDRLRQQAKNEIEQWWNKRREEDAKRIEEARAEARQEGWQLGREQAEQQVRAEYETVLDQAAAVMEKAHLEKDKIIAEAEPFLLELSVEIAAKVITKQLELSPDWIVAVIKDVLGRRKEVGRITLCVAPEHFAHVSDAREELLLVLDSQAELEIVPDKRVQDAGCIVRSSYGSMDARIDTQLSEIKKALLKLSRGGTEEEEASDHAAG